MNSLQSSLKEARFHHEVRPFLLGSWTEPETSAQSRIFGEMLEQIEYAEEVGFDSIWIAEHHSSRYGICPSLMPLLSHIAARTRKI